MRLGKASGSVGLQPLAMQVYAFMSLEQRRERGLMLSAACIKEAFLLQTNNEGPMTANDDPLVVRACRREHVHAHATPPCNSIYSDLEHTL